MFEYQFQCSYVSCAGFGSKRLFSIPVHQAESWLNDEFPQHECDLCHHLFSIGRTEKEDLLVSLAFQECGVSSVSDSVRVM